MIPAFPLHWPDGFKRSIRRETGAFRTTLSKALENAEGSLKRFARDTGISVSDIVFSSNVGGLMASRRPDDPGIALWFMWDGAQRCIPVDRYTTPEANLQAIHHIIEADRTKLRHGNLEIVRASYRGFIALPAPESKRSWRSVLRFSPDSIPTREQIEGQYRKYAKQAHPDTAGGSNEAMAELNAAKAAALREIGQ